MVNDQDVLVEEIPGQDGALGLLTLNRPQVLNALNLSMIHALHAALQRFAVAAHIKAVVIRAAAGRAFCAGGDLRLIYDHAHAADKTAAHYFRDEYQLNRCIFHFPKPYIALLDGITMGGGVGISVHGSHRVATDKLVFALPETGIGFFPDVGATYLLPRLANNVGFYLGLTGIPLKGDECVALGIAQQKVASDALPALWEALIQQPLGKDPKTTVTQLIQHYAEPVKTSPLLLEQEAIKTHFSAVTVEAILESLQEAKTPLCQAAATIILKKSPTSLKVTLNALQRGKNLAFDECMQQEYRLSCHFLEGHDFFEGIRAVIIDKDQTPKWQPAELSAITPEAVERYFSPIKNELV